jgi:hypothetical protein
VDNSGISAQSATGDGQSWTTCPLLRIRCSRTCCAPNRAIMLADTNQQAGRLICARICARDAAGHAETEETQKAGDDFMPQVCRGQRGDRRLSEMGEAHVVWLITQRRMGSWCAILLRSCGRRQQASQSTALSLPWPSMVRARPWNGSWNGSPRNSSAISASGAICCAICAGQAIGARERASCNALLAGFPTGGLPRSGHVPAN